MYILSLLVCLFLVGTGAQAALETLTLGIPIAKPTNAFQVPADFVSFGIESAFLSNFANKFSENLVNSVGSRMSAPPVLRIGGTSGDNFLVDPSSKVIKDCFNVCHNTGSLTSLAHFIVGPKYFDGFKAFPNARMTFQAPLDRNANVTNAVAFASRAWAALGAKRVAGIALGNEPGVYDADAVQYVNGALQIENAIVQKLGLSGNAAKIFEAGNIEFGAILRGQYNIKDLLKTRINDNGRISSTAEHYYQVSEGPWTDAHMQKAMLNHTAIATRLGLYTESIKASNAAGLPYYLNEGAAVSGGAPAQFSGGYGYTLWSVDYNLAAMSRGVSRVTNLAGNPNASRVFWVPDDSAIATNTGAQVRAPFPAAPFVADFIGKKTSSVVEIATKHDLLSAYAMYESGTLARVALVNMRLWNETAGGTRGAEVFSVPVGKVNSVTLRRLVADKGVAAMGFDYGGKNDNVTWAGEQWSKKIDNGIGHFASGGIEQQKVPVSNGYASIKVPDSGAVIMFIS